MNSENKRIPGQWVERNTSRDADRDEVMKSIFSQPGLGAEVARKLGLMHQNVSNWNRVPARHVLKVAALLGMKPTQIRPDIFGTEDT